jgi:hypothetical protein
MVLVVVVAGEVVMVVLVVASVVVHGRVQKERMEFWLGTLV